MRNKGFTLIELLAVIVILAIIFSIVTITVGGTINNSESSLSKTQKKSIENAAKTYYIEEGMDEGNTCINLSFLINKGYIKSSEVKDPKTKETMNGSVRVTTNGDKHSYNYKDEACSICTPVTSSTLGNVPSGNFVAGDEYTCQVNDTTTHNFYILNTEGDKVNLIMDRNICKDGTETTGSNTCTVEWATQEDVIQAGGTKDKYGNYSTSKGPVTALKFLNEATSSWTNIPNLNETYTDENAVQEFNYGTITLTGKARMIKSSEISTFKEAQYLFNYLKNNPMANFSNIIDGIYGYWSISSATYYGKTLYYMGGSNYSVVSDKNYGVRPVIKLNKTEFEVK